MSFDQLMQHAHDIAAKAAEIARRERTPATTGRSGVGAPPMDQIRQEFASIEPAFEPFTKMPDPAHYDPLINDLKRAMGQVNTGSAPQTQLTGDVMLSNVDLAHMKTDGDYLAGWTGEAAMAFKKNFVDPFGMVAGNQFTALSTMRGVLEAHQAMWAAARKDIDNIAETTLHALDNVGGCNKTQWSYLFTVLSAVATIASGIITVGTGGATAPIVPVAAGVALGNVTLGGANLSQSGSSAESVISSMMHGIDTLRQHIQDVEQNHIANYIPPLIGAFTDNKDKLVAARPTLAGMSLPDLYGDHGMGGRN
ncbi:hypothetical protein ABZ942_41495 [Nocardia sp. NPDC046473]|uniref:hypothetical protein n=1 Tax=Nocardia sp. NPDC046473 TaxID=3155733 RepID=UPI0033FEF97C